MSENPLLPHRRLQELYALTLRARELDRAVARAATRKRPGRSARLGQPAREALLAGTSIHLEAGDLLCGEAGDSVAVQLAPPVKASARDPLAIHPLDSATSAIDASTLPGPRLPLCAALARGLQAGASGVLLAYARAGAAEPGWADALAWAQAAQLPLLLACADARGSRARSAGNALNYDAVTRLAKRAHVPVLSVDGEDAVAVYRVMQEAILRARLGGGPAILWALCSPPKASGPLPRNEQPVARLATYLRSRSIPLTSPAPVPRGRRKRQRNEIAPVPWKGHDRYPERHPVASSGAPAFP